MTSGVLQRIESILSHLPSSEQKIAQYILDHPNEVIHLTAAQIGQVTQTSGAAVVRLCKSLKLNGLQDLKMRLAGDLVKPVKSGYRDVDLKEPVESIISKVTDNHIQCLKDTMEILDVDALKKAVTYLLEAKSIYLFGIGASGIIAQDAQHKFLRVNKNATAFSDVHVNAMILANALPTDVFFAISYSGETKEVVDLIALAKKYGLRTISLSKFGHHAVDEYSDVSLKISSSYEAKLRSAATVSRLAQLYVIDILFLSMASQEYEKTMQYIDSTRQAIQMIKDHR
ncbi:MurR/RpiR family transcriptional regulator [Thermoflavimicrobium dichotomicum]|uniref:DNA-binding transcriptional regulator, MurR/RpiR family, contains HTH and SIS domains n=1 Tax=Thermoflavimicrobium dichotomicum TaxID=46223 RepID=A0A1I3TD38_9BACL|nr:MurR/RpiR family transcriptional regulator [Thermoflavimicrobium dichotomicum]SFJ67407.1 DNA-binding transcriptional regulator, MurR/RpiR family, contains HTH and SIS domains [Thermoflavimicrobium dichotomicum]